MAQLFIEPLARAFTQTGAVGEGFKYTFYTTGTTTPITTYSDSTLTTPNASPVVADANGRFGPIWISNLATTKSILTDADDVVIETVDPVGTTSSTTSLNDLDVRPTSYWGLTAGSSTAYTLTANPSISAYSNVQTFYFQPHIASGTTPTMAISGLAAMSLKKYTGQGTKVDLTDGDLQATQRYHAINDGVDIVILNPRVLPINSGVATELTIASGSITIDNSSGSYVIDTEGAAATDNLVTINGGNDGQIIVLTAASSTRNVVLIDGIGNISSQTGGDVVIASSSQQVFLRYSAATASWEIAFSSLVKSILQERYTETGASSTGTTTIPLDNTIPQITEGFQVMTLAITPISATSTLRIEVLANVASNSAQNSSIALFQDSTAGAIAAGATGRDAAETPFQPQIIHEMTSGTTSSTTFSVRVGNATGGTLTFNGRTGVRLFGGVMASSITITEIQE